MEIENQAILEKSLRALFWASESLHAVVCGLSEAQKTFQMQSEQGSGHVWEVFSGVIWVVGICSEADLLKKEALPVLLYNAILGKLAQK